jgi:Txe/YoeB family toxin of Txe-Axe toxin-antitoxin module
MEVIFLPDAGTDFNYWIDTNNKPILKKIARFIDGIKINPYS